MTDVQDDQLYQPDEDGLLVSVARFDDWPVTLTLTDGSSPSREETVKMLGEMVVAGDMVDGQFMVRQVQHLAMSSQTSLPELGGAISIAGTANPADVEAGPAGKIEPFETRIYYPLLSSADLGLAWQESNASYPLFETMTSRLRWESGPGIKPTLEVWLDNNKIGASHTGAIEGIVFEKWTLSLNPPVDERYESGWAGGFLREYDSTLAAVPGNRHHVRKLHLRFVAEPAVLLDATLETAVKSWIEHAGAAWCDQGGIVLAPEPDIDEWQGVLTIASVETRLESTSPLPPAKFINIFLVKTLHAATGGGVTIRCGTNSAYVFLHVEEPASITSPHVLAHELGHVLGLYHPGELCGGDATYRQGSLDSVLVPGHSGLLNTLNNISVVPPYLTPPVYETLDNLCRWNPDPRPEEPLFQFIWNSALPLHALYNDVHMGDQIYENGSDVFVNGSPGHIEPTAVDAKNYLCIRLLDCRRPSALKVFLYLVDDDPLNPNLRLLPGTAAPTGPHLNFPANQNNLPDDLGPKTGAVEWTVPEGPRACWVFAVVTTGSTAPGAITTAITEFIKKDNDLSVLTPWQHRLIGRRLNVPGRPV